MSYDIDLTMDAGEREPMRWEVGNMTSNVAPMWTLAGADLAAFHGKQARECIPLLRGAIAAMEDNPTPFRELNPPNGWGDYDTCLSYLRDVLASFVRYPLATVEVSR